MSKTLKRLLYFGVEIVIDIEDIEFKIDGEFICGYHFENNVYNFIEEWNFEAEMLDLIVRFVGELTKWDTLKLIKKQFNMKVITT